MVCGKLSSTFFHFPPGLDSSTRPVWTFSKEASFSNIILCLHFFHQITTQPRSSPPDPMYELLSLPDGQIWRNYFSHVSPRVHMARVGYFRNERAYSVEFSLRMCAHHTCCVIMDVGYVLFLVCLYICVCVRLHIQGSVLGYRSSPPGASGLPYYCAPLVPDVIGWLSVWRHNKPKAPKKKPCYKLFYRIRCCGSETKCW